MQTCADQVAFRCEAGFRLRAKLCSAQGLGCGFAALCAALSGLQGLQLGAGGPFGAVVVSCVQAVSAGHSKGKGGG